MAVSPWWCAGGEKLKAAKAKVTKLQKDIHEAEADASKKAVQVRCCAAAAAAAAGQPPIRAHQRARRHAW